MIGIGLINTRLASTDIVAVAEEISGGSNASLCERRSDRCSWCRDRRARVCALLFRSVQLMVTAWTTQV